jgi:hypothetical protein
MFQYHSPSYLTTQSLNKQWKRFFYQGNTHSIHTTKPTNMTWRQVIKTGINVKLCEPNLTFHIYLHHIQISAPPQKEQNFFLLCDWTSQHKWNVLISKTTKLPSFDCPLSSYHQHWQQSTHQLGKKKYYMHLLVKFEQNSKPIKSTIDYYALAPFHKKWLT